MGGNVMYGSEHGLAGVDVLNLPRFDVREGSGEGWDSSGDGRSNEDVGVLDHDEVSSTRGYEFVKS